LKDGKNCEDLEVNLKRTAEAKIAINIEKFVKKCVYVKGVRKDCVNKKINVISKEEKCAHSGNSMNLQR